ncbi:MAG: hypothetical protein IJG13_22230 [Kiritimatiellae bacterium]|nr:hypothetical protein [Kiritimatiellia bacterium]
MYRIIAGAALPNLRDIMSATTARQFVDSAAMPHAKSLGFSCDASGENRRGKNAQIEYLAKSRPKGGFSADFA